MPYISEIESKVTDFVITAKRLDNTARLRGSVNGDAWRTVMRDIAGQAQRELVAIYKELAEGEAENAEAEKLASEIERIVA